MFDNITVQDQVKASSFNDGLQWLSNGGDRSQFEGGEADSNGGEAALDLIYGHLPTTPSQSYEPVHRNIENQLTNWFRPSGDWQPDDEKNIVVKIQRFQAGGYECSASSISLPDLARLMDAPRKTGTREKPEELDQENVIRSAQRAKRKVRYLIKSMGCDRLLTVTLRESHPAYFWTREQWAKAWDRFVRQCARNGEQLQYVAVLEQHEKGNFHLHAALTGLKRVEVLRRLWWAIVGKGEGNIDIAFKKHMTPYQRRSGVAKYVSKYITKQVEIASNFNKKRYWSSKHD